MSSCQLFKHLRRQLTIVSTVRRFAQNSPSNHSVQVLVPLKNRKLLKVSGKDAPNFLQGLITNDMRHFNEHAKSMYAMFLNNKGRVLYDTLIYKWENDQSFLVECDESISNALQKHLKLFKLKQAVNIEDMFRTLYLWALISPVNNVSPVKINTNSPINIFKDPRLTELGCRIVTVPAMAADEIIDIVGQENEVKLGDEDIYKYLRYKLGVGEGAEELPPGLCYPLEANCDYLHGVSFHKGCYIGQELTARVHHTGVVRKRLMPIRFNREITEYLEKDSLIKVPGDAKSKLGKLKGYMHNYGLGLVRVKEALEAKCLIIGDFSAQVDRPEWWPLEAPKEKPIEAIKEIPIESVKGTPLEETQEHILEETKETILEEAKGSPILVETEEETQEHILEEAKGSPILVETEEETQEHILEEAKGTPFLVETEKIYIKDTKEKPINETKEELSVNKSE